MPLLLSDLREQIKDVDLRESEEINGNLSIRTAWEKMTEMNTHTLPITRDGMLEGVITKGRYRQIPIWMFTIIRCWQRREPSIGILQPL